MHSTLRRWLFHLLGAAVAVILSFLARATKHLTAAVVLVQEKLAGAAKYVCV